MELVGNYYNATTIIRFTQFDRTITIIINLIPKRKQLLSGQSVTLFILMKLRVEEKWPHPNVQTFVWWEFYNANPKQ